MRAALALLALGACGRADFDPVGDAGPDANPITNPPPPNFTAGTRLQPNIYRGGDVARRFAWHDTLLDVDCFAAITTDGTTRCVPQDASTQAIYSDAACTIELGYREASLDACGPPKFSSTRVNNVWTTHTVVGPHTGAVYTNSSGSCQTTTTNALLDLGPVVSPSTFLGSHEELTRNHDLSYTEAVFDDGSRELTSLIHDHAHDETCAVVPVSTDSGLCLPLDIDAGRLYYKDAACTDGVVSVTDPSKPFLLERGDVCGESVRVFEAGAGYAGAVYELEAAGCALQAAPPLTYELIAPGADIYPRFQRTLRPGAGPVREARWTTADGFDIGTTDLWNDQRNEWCTPFVDGTTSQLICGPYYSELTQTVYGDAACGTVVDRVVPACVETGGSFYYPTSSSFHVCDGLRFLPALFDRPFTAPAFMQTERGCLRIPAATGLMSMSSTIGVDATQYPAMVRE
ncbi:MAG TPA: hypothetical protein VGM90_31775 [Kofleriaceae bacterium]|jgi:hypothetical protein